MRQLEEEHFILFSRQEAAGLFDQIISVCQKEKFTLTISSQPNDMQMPLAEVSTGLGVSVAPWCIKKMYTKGCVFVPIEKKNSSISTQLHYRSDPILPTVETFVEIILKSRGDIQKQMEKE